MNSRLVSRAVQLLAMGGLVAASGGSRPGAEAEERRAVLAQGQATPAAQPSRARGGNGAGQGPEYDEKGELKRPVGYETWVFVGSNLGLEYSDDVTKEKPAEKEAKEKKRPAKGVNFHNVYINPEAYAAYMKTGKFPEKTVLILDVFKAEEREKRNIVSEGLFPGARAGMAVAVKNSARPDGSKTDWTDYEFEIG